jgi:hypothetical protein
MMADYTISNIRKNYYSISFDKNVIMYNHIHLNMIIHKGGGRTMRAPTISMSSIKCN